MKIPRNQFGKIKTVLHGLQATFVFLGFCLTAAILVNGEIDGRSKYYFALCFFTVPALVYLVMVPRWPRAAKVANVHVFAIVDALFAILWLAAFIAVATYNPDNMSQDSEGEESEDDTETENEDDDGGGCSALCNTNKAAVAFGVFNFLLFLATSGISFYDIMQYRRDGTSVIIQSDYQKTSSSSAAAAGGGAIGLDAHSKDAWSADTDELDESGYHRNPHYGHDDDDNDDDGDDEFHNGYNGYNGYGRVETHGASSLLSGAGAGAGAGAGSRLGHYNDVDDDDHALLSAASQPGRRRPSASDFGTAPAGYGDNGDSRFNEDTAYHAGVAAAPPPPPPPPPLPIPPAGDARWYNDAGHGNENPSAVLGVNSNNDPAAGKVKFPDGNYSFSG